jgi:hypothetical protein
MIATPGPGIVQVGVVVLTITRGTGSALRTYFTV